MSVLRESARQIFTLFDAKQFAAAGDLMQPEATIWLPNTREVFRGRDKYIHFNEAYPGHWRFTIEKMYESGQTVITAARVFSADNPQCFHVTVFMTFKDGLIADMSEYWGNDEEPPDWRLAEQLSERY